jgi:hypothetical protein
LLPCLASNPITSQVSVSVISETFVKHRLDRVRVVLLALLFNILEQGKGREEHAMKTLVKSMENFVVTE